QKHGEQGKGKIAAVGDGKHERRARHSHRGIKGQKTANFFKTAHHIKRHPAAAKQSGRRNNSGGNTGRGALAEDRAKQNAARHEKENGGKCGKCRRKNAAPRHKKRNLQKTHCPHHVDNMVIFVVFADLAYKISLPLYNSS
ncbi:MAG: hypothetical protein IIX61_06235, partial [Loktanella sp.]|nr:hypothetical protein [Loktanella sp.]